MAELHELERVARVVSILRPGWHPKSILTWLTSTPAGQSVACRPYAVVAVAFVACAVDERSDTPARVAEPGPWWQVADRAARPAPATYLPGPGDDPACRRPGHEHERAAACRWCRAEDLAATIDPPTFGTAPEPRPCTGCTRSSRFLLDGRCITCRTGTPTRLTQLAPTPAKEHKTA